jgi:Subtilase family
MTRRTRRRPSPAGETRQPAARAGAALGKPELIFLARPEVGLRLSPSGFRAAARAEARGLAEVLDIEGITVQPLFGLSEDRLRERLAALPGAVDLPDLTTFFHVEAPEEQLAELAESLRELEAVEAAYVKPAGAPPIEDEAPGNGINDMAPAEEEPASQTPDFSSRQLYLNAAPPGIDARYAWQFRGGRGAGVNIIDCEWGWRFTHEDLVQNQGGVIVGSSASDDNHGTAVLGEYGGDHNNFGTIGICPDSRASAASFLTLPTATVIRQAADRLGRGDILLLEIHRPGPGASGVGQDGYIAIEWWPDDFAAIRYAIARGVIVVEAAGNGARNLDDALYDQPAQGFPASWRNPFNPANPSSGAIVVGAGAPPPGTHGRDHGPDRSRLGFSNYGQRVDAQGWGREVTTTAYGDLQGGSNRDLWYTDQFSGTSSASPIIVGALGCVQGILRARNRPLLTPPAARQLLRTTGSPQQDAPGRPRNQRIGNRPNLRQMIGQVLGLTPGTAEGEEGMEGVVPAGRFGQVVININSPGVTININGPSESGVMNYASGLTQR